ncbi:uncharacterized protein LOC128228003 [Mya arenaria]|nr:uncharacterized protein LOC128228003 [Mya arenaria]
MATGGEPLPPSDQVYDFACTSCEADNVNTEAQFSCKECENYLCNKCIKLHNGIFKRHDVLGLFDVIKWEGEKCLEKCEKHPEKSVKMVCEDHDELCCSLCVALSHRRCRSIRLIDDLAKGVKNTDFDECDSKPEQFVHDTQSETSSTTARKRDDPNYVYKTKATHIHNLRLKDENECCIQGICELQTGEIVLADCTNDKMKVLNREFKIVTTLNLPQHTENMCFVGGNEVALAVDDAKKKHEVHFIAIHKSKAKSISKFAVAHYCNAVSFHNDNVYVGSESSVYMYSKKGKMIKVVYQALGIAMTMNGIHASNDGQKIYITDSSNDKVITINNSGTVSACCEDQELILPVSLCVSEHGHVFACALQSNSVLQIDKEGKRKLRTLVSGNKIHNPLVVYFSTRSQQLMVAGITNDLLVADLI